VLWCETAGGDARDLEDLAVFASQLERLDITAAVHVRSVPAGLNRNAQFDLAPYLRDEPMAADDGLVVLAAHRLEDHKLADLRRLAGGEPRRCVAFGSFPRRQALVAATAKLSYVVGRDPDVVDLGAEGAIPGDGAASAPVFGVARRSVTAARPRVLVVGPDVGDGRQLAALGALASTRTLRAAVLTDGQAKRERLAGRGGAPPPFYHYGEILPASLAERVDVCALFVPLQKNYRLQCLVADLAVSGVPLLDCTADHALVRTNDAFLPGPAEPATLLPFLTTEVLPNLAALGDHVRGSTTAARFGTAGLRARLAGAPGGEAPPDRPAPPRRRPAAGGAAKLVIMPTNGVGLGHAQRCVLIADECDRARLDPVFAVFPSCGGLVKSYGYDAMPLVRRSPLHAQSHENDLANYLRLRALAADARALVFDGGYVFDSVYRTILEHGLEGVWIRRGLWQSEQDNTATLDREKAFARVIVPSEAFDELNVAYSYGDHVRAVGPIVRPDALDADRRSALRARLAERYGVAFERLVVTQLGGGVAADRGAQIQAICGVLERRAEVLHLVLAWPTAVLEPGWFRWSRTRVVKTHHAGVLAAAADLCVTAAGYNAFHEVLYGRRAAIFVPQTGAFMDDQRARALAAHERGLAGFVEPHQLMTLERQIARHLDGGEAETVRGRIAALDLPAPGNAAAAGLIAELTDADPPLERAAGADRRR
jgi:hypothetical protein